ncbi:MAG TPA: ATP-binding cassette domain-containing protein [Anaerolineales bacterium]|jgi:energy-coupling factor transporter ATP-binding protein EcfA2
MIHVEEVTYVYPGARLPALRDISLDIPEGQFYAVVGPNQAGKSTLAYAMAGYIPHFYRGRLEGKVTVAGLDTRATPLHELVLTAGLIFQNPFNQISGTKFTVREEIAFGLENLGMPRGEMRTRVDETMELVGINHLADRSPLALSGGEMQRVAIASILAMKPKVLILDEPTSQLDPIGSREVFSAVRSLISSEKMTVVMIEHKLEWVAVFADYVIAMVDGQILANGSPSSVLTLDTLQMAGAGQTRYTRAARRARDLGSWPDQHELPVTLEEAEEAFRRLKTGA